MTQRIDLLTLFPQMAEGFLSESILGKALEQGLLELELHNLRDWSTDKHHKVDDRPFGGGAGMVLMPEPLFAAIEALKREDTTTIYLCPDGEPLSTAMAQELAQMPHLLLVSGHYEGIDQRVRDCLIDREVSIGDYVLTNGTLPAAVLIDCVARHIPGVLGEEKSLTQDSFNDNFLTFPQFTRPAEYRGMRVPDVLLSGDHAAIERWR
ncbi:MAG: tRNA (guanosine(37)-N1)-methyltransferase TrmD, partial [Verrucomicrobiota bacterium]